MMRDRLPSQGFDTPIVADHVMIITISGWTSAPSVPVILRQFFYKMRQARHYFIA